MDAAALGDVVARAEKRLLAGYRRERDWPPEQLRAAGEWGPEGKSRN
jgi:hypothetical protein